MMAGRCAPLSNSAARSATDGGAGRREARPRCPARGDLRGRPGLDVDREHEHDRPALGLGALVGPQRIVGRGLGGVQALGDRPHRLDEPVLVDAEVRGQRGRRGLAGQDEERRAALGRLGQPGHRVGQPRTLVHADHAHASRHPRVAVGGGDRPGFQTRVVQGGAAGDERLGDDHVARAQQPEDVAHALRGQRLADHVGHRARRGGPRRGGGGCHLRVRHEVGSPRTGWSRLHASWAHAEFPVHGPRRHIRDFGPGVMGKPRLFRPSRRSAHASPSSRNPCHRADRGDPVPRRRRPGEADHGGGNRRRASPPWTSMRATPGIEVLRRGGNAVDAAVATASALGVTIPFVAGPGGGGFMVIYNARTHRVTTIDGRENCPAACTSTMFIDPATGMPMNYTTASDQPLSTGVPGMVATWAKAVALYGNKSLAADLQPAISVARRGFRVNFDFTQLEQSGLSRSAGLQGQPRAAADAVGRRPAGGHPAAQPRSRAHLRADRPRGPVGVLQRADRRGAGQGRRPPRAGARGRRASPTTGSCPWPTCATTTPRSLAPTHVNYRGLDVLRDGPALERRLDRGRDPQHPQRLQPRRRAAGDGALPLPRSLAPGLRRPQPLRR